MGTYPPLEGVRDPWGSEHAELCEADSALSDEDNVFYKLGGMVGDTGLGPVTPTV